jgi:hypothetical protein
LSFEEVHEVSPPPTMIKRCLTVFAKKMLNAITNNVVNRFM